MKNPSSLEQLAKVLSEEYVVSVQPDHPYLLSGPDILAGGSGNLLAVFQPKKSELRSPDKLLSRLALSRLALPSHAQCVILAELDNFDNVEINSIVSNFHLALEVKMVPLTKKLLSEIQKRPKNDIPPVPPKLRAKNYQRAGVLFEVSNFYLPEFRNQTKSLRKATFQEFPEEIKKSKLSANSWMDPTKTRQKKRIYTSTVDEPGMLSPVETVLSSTDANLTIPIRSQISAFCDTALQYDFFMEGGDITVNWHFEGTTKLLLTPDIPHNVTDPEKFLRSTTFAGWVMSEPRPVNEFQGLLEDVVRTVRNKTHES